MLVRIRYPNMSRSWFSVLKLDDFLMSFRSWLLYFPTDVDPCQDYNCSYYAVCFASTPTTPTCICQPCHGRQVQPICDVNGVTYQCRCEYQLAVCKAQSHIPTRHLGGCKRKFHCNACITFFLFLFTNLFVFLVKHTILFSHFNSWLVFLSPNRTVRVWTPTRSITLHSWARQDFHCASLCPSV